MAKEKTKMTRTETVFLSEKSEKIFQQILKYREDLGLENHVGDQILIKVLAGCIEKFNRAEEHLSGEGRKLIEHMDNGSTKVKPEAAIMIQMAGLIKNICSELLMSQSSRMKNKFEGKSDKKNDALAAILKIAK